MSKGKTIKQVAAALFNHIEPTRYGNFHATGNKFLKRPLKGPGYLQWVKPDIYPDFTGLGESWYRWMKKSKNEYLVATGRAPVKKGEGKRAQKSKGRASGTAGQSIKGDTGKQKTL